MERYTGMCIGVFLCMMLKVAVAVAVAVVVLLAVVILNRQVKKIDLLYIAHDVCVLKKTLAGVVYKRQIACVLFLVL